ncbi:helix-turn-helix transcriptional regulator [Leucobacter coleopterorum]|uniref:Helix-turn-helix transcriptional regulator n=2 Tax=Leucobacter coleopterorum TaxID=2714933 RepID=A0ABX6JZS1_9MICO|nr:helix-turn-helix transcriptional regulator [Leucobacter coleopterorum]
MFLDSLEPGTHRAGKMEPVVAHLTEREREVAQLLVQGMTSQEVHKHLAISIRTVENHVHNIKQKLGVSKRSEAIEWLRLGCAQGWDPCRLEDDSQRPDKNYLDHSSPAGRFYSPSRRNYLGLPF